MLSKHLTGKWRRVATGSAGDDRSRGSHEEIAKRDAALQRLEQTITEQNACIDELRETITQSEYKAGILERSYAKQLTEARERANAAEQLVDEQSAAITELENTTRTLRSELDDAKSRLDMFGPEAGSIDEMLEAFSQPKEQPDIRDIDVVEDTADESQADDLIAPDVMLAAKRKAAAGG